MYNENHSLYEWYQKAYCDELKRILKRISGNEINGERNKEEIQVPAGAFLSCFGKKGSKEADLGEALTESLSECTVSMYTGIPTLSRSPPRPPPGRCASVKRAEIEWEYTQLTILFTR